ncbi:hypothetical protein [Phormidesmis priestleyi]|uniref:hypothetical protein n=1 Tax=Phormidesmis priestleyi TaxID=268141 RepID=UPI000A9E5382|nr:hypothetical protein [Phormidesmis priestleyi]
MHDISSRSDSFNKLFSRFCPPFYSIEPLQGKSLKFQWILENEKCAIVLARFLDRFIAFLQDFGFCKLKRSRNCSIATRWRRQKSHSFTLRSCRSASQEKQRYAASTEKLRAYQNCKTFTGKGLRAFLLVRTAISWRVLAYRFSLKKSAQIEREAGRPTGYQERSFWRWIKPFPDSEIVLLEDAAFLQTGGAS